MFVFLDKIPKWVKLILKRTIHSPSLRYMPNLLHIDRYCHFCQGRPQALSSPSSKSHRSRNNSLNFSSGLPMRLLFDHLNIARIVLGHDRIRLARSEDSRMVRGPDIVHGNSRWRGGVTVIVQRPGIIFPRHSSLNYNTRPAQYGACTSLPTEGNATRM